MKIRLFLFGFVLCQSIMGQTGTSSAFIYSKDFSKDNVLYKAKAFVMKEVLKGSSEVSQFQIEPLATTTSKEVTTVIYKCEAKNKEGLLLGFYGDYINEAGIVNQGFAFKDLPKTKAVGLLDLITRTIEEKKAYLAKDTDNNNVYFQYDDLMVLIYTSIDTKIRIFWSFSAYKSTVKKFEKSLN
jgi:hypothetical protein